MKYTEYRIQKRKYSSNIIEGGYYENDKLVWKPILAPLISKKQGDELCEKLNTINFIDKL